MERNTNDKPLSLSGDLMSLWPDLSSDGEPGNLTLSPTHSSSSTPTLSAKMLLSNSPFISPLPLHPNGGAMRSALTIQAAKQLTGRVVTTKANKTVGVEVARLAPHPKYKRRERIKKKYQAHDPDNQFKVGDVVELRRSRPISKTKHFLAVPLPPRDTRRKSQLLPPLQSESQADAAQEQTPPPSSE